MKETKDFVQSIKENRTCDNFLFFVVTIKDFLGQLNVPVRKLIPDEVVEDVSSYTKLKLVKVFSNFADRLIEVVENPAVSDIACLTSRHLSDMLTRYIQRQAFIVHEDIAGNVPDFVNEVP